MAASHCPIAKNLVDQVLFGEALEMQDKALEMSRRALGEDQVDVAHTS